MADTPHFYIILNQVAGTGRAQKIWPQIETVLKQRGISYELQISSYPGHTTRIAYQFARFKRTNQVLLIIGGDGTLNQAINGVQNAGKTDIPIAYLPCGSGNDFARGIGLNSDPLQALEQILATSAPVNIDLGVYHDALKDETGYFVNNVGIGFDASVVSITNNSKSKRFLNKCHLGSLSYVFSLIQAFTSQDAFQVTVKANGSVKNFSRGFLVTTTNHPYFGSGVPIMPSARVDDQKLDLVVIEKLNVFFFCYLFIMMLMGKHTRYKAVHHFRADDLVVRTQTLEFGQVDGEEMGSRAFDMHFNVTSQPFWLTTDQTEQFK